MKRTAYLILALLLLCCLPSSAQTFSTTADLDINNIRAAHLVHGDMWWDPATGTPRCEYPKGSGKHVGFVASLWMGGYDAQSALHVAAQTYRQNGNDYWPGPLTTGTPAQVYNTSKDWSRIWKLNRTTVDSFRALSSPTVASTPPVILEWPAKGNPNAKGFNNAALTITTDMAPFVDVNGDGHYNALDGDYPVMKGDQMLWWVINDNGPTHNESNGLPLNMLIRVTAYAFSRGTIADNILFYEYSLTNMSAGSYNSLRMGLATDIDLGYAFDDYIGFDSSRRMGIAYNGTNMDQVYGNTLPMAGIALLELPGDIGNTYVPAGSFMGYTNSSGGGGNPSAAVQYFNLLNSANNLGTPLPNNARYAYGEQTECSLNNQPGDRRFVIASNNMSFAAGETKKIAMALVVTPNTGGCPVMTFTAIHQVADTAWHIYHPSVSGPTGIPCTAGPRKLRIYPNPATDLLKVDMNDNGMGSLTVFDAIGKEVPLPVISHGSTAELAVGGLPAGMYHIVYRNGGQVTTGTFMKD